MSFELQFLIMINSPDNIERVIERIRANLTGSVMKSSKSFEWQSNWVQVWRNNDYDANLINDVEEGFLYYPYRIEISPSNEVTLEKQLDVAREIKKALINMEYDFEICADFESIL